MTLGEISVVVEGCRERERRDTISRITAAIRALGAAFGGNSEPYRGLDDAEPSRPITPKEARVLRFWKAATNG